MQTGTAMKLRPLFALIGLLVFAHPGQASVYETRLFIQAMVGGVQAKSKPCPDVVVEVTDLRNMAAVCAFYDGDFDGFRAAWHASMQSSYAGADRYRTARSEAQSRTDWEEGNGFYERIYAVGETIVGVRFTKGELLFVYK